MVRKSAPARAHASPVLVHETNTGLSKSCAMPGSMLKVNPLGLQFQHFYANWISGFLRRLFKLIGVNDTVVMWYRKFLKK